MANSGTKFLFGFIVGILTGAAIGLLMAPEPGEDTRNMIKSKLDEYAEEGKKVYEEYKKKLAKED
jgi:gas vesicle protein